MRALRWGCVVVAGLWTLQGAAIDRGEFRGEAQQVNAATEFDVLRPRVATSAYGDTVVGWLELARDGAPAASQGWVRFFRADGTARGAQQNVYFSVPSTFYSDTVVGIDDAGVATVAWMSRTSATQPGERLFLRRYSRAGAALGPATSIDLISLASLEPALAVAPGGEAIIAWTQRATDSLVELRVVRLDETGVVTAPPASVASVETAAEIPALRIGIDDSGDAVIAWVFAGDLFWRRLPANAPLGPVSQVNVGSSVGPADLAVEGMGGFTAAWVSATSDRVLRRRYDGAGAPLEGETEIFAGTVGAVSVDVDASGGTLVAWSALSTPQLFAQAFDAEGSASAPGVVVADVDEASVEFPDVALDADGDAVLSWQLTTLGDESDRNSFIRGLTGPADVDLAITIDDGESGAPGSSEGRYEVAVTNTRAPSGPGVGQAEGVVAEIVLPDGHEVIELEAEDWRCSGAARVTCVLKDSLPASEQRDLVLRLLRADFLCENAQARVSVTSQQFDSVDGNDAMTDATLVGAPGVVSFVAAANTATESDAQVELEVRRDDGCVGDLNVSFVTESGTADSGNDFGDGGSFVFPEGASRASFTVSLVDDEIEEQDETFNVVLTGANGGGAVVTPERTTVTITDDESRGGGGGAMPAALLWLLAALAAGCRRIVAGGRRPL